MNGVQGNVPLLGATQEAQRAAAEQLFLSMYAPLIPQLSVYRVANGYVTDGGFDSVEATPERIADEAFCIVDAAMRRLGAPKCGK